MSTLTATALQGETLDAIVWRVLGVGAPVVEETLELNRGIAAGGAVLAEGQAVILPLVDRQTVAERDIVKLWD